MRALSVFHYLPFSHTNIHTRAHTRSNRKFGDADLIEIATASANQTLAGSSCVSVSLACTLSLVCSFLLYSSNCKPKCSPWCVHALLHDPPNPQLPLSVSNILTLSSLPCCFCVPLSLSRTMVCACTQREGRSPRFQRVFSTSST